VSKAPVTRLKILCICQGGNCRSVGAGFILKLKYGHDVLSCGWQLNSPGTVKMLIDWADRVVVLQRDFLHFLRAVAHDIDSKAFIADVGEDRFGNPLHPELQELLAPMLDKWHSSGYCVKIKRKVIKRKRRRKCSVS
jgi:hypothetical protein